MHGDYQGNSDSDLQIKTDELVTPFFSYFGCRGIFVYYGFQFCPCSGRRVYKLCYTNKIA